MSVLVFSIIRNFLYFPPSTKYQENFCPVNCQLSTVILYSSSKVLCFFGRHASFLLTLVVISFDIHFKGTSAVSLKHLLFLWDLKYLVGMGLQGHSYCYLLSNNPRLVILQQKFIFSAKFNGVLSREDFLLKRIIHYNKNCCLHKGVFTMVFTLRNIYEFKVARVVSLKLVFTV